MTLTILGLGTAVPAHLVTQQEATELARDVICQTAPQARLLEVLYRRAGVDQRFTVLPHRIAMNWVPAGQLGAGDTANSTTLGPTTAERMEFFSEHASPLALRAARLALDEAGVASQHISHLITVSCTGFTAPGVDIDLIAGLRLKPTTQRIQVGFMGCHGAINGLRVAQALATADPSARVLVCATELCSLHYRFRWDPERIVANALFADGAAAIVGAAGPTTPNDDWRVLATGSCLLPNSAGDMTWRIGDHGFEMTLSPAVPELIRQHLRTWLAEWLQSHGHRIDTVGSWAIHPGGPRILGAVEECLGLDRESTAVSREVLAQFGNMSSPTVLFIVERLRARHAPRPCVALGFGPGLFAEVALFG